MTIKQLLFHVCTSLLLLTSCSKTLTDDSMNEFGTGLNTMPKYLCDVTFTYTSSKSPYEEITKYLFRNPTYENGRLVSACCNFNGQQANHIYEYNSNMITLRSGTIDNGNEVYYYTLRDGFIISCRKLNTTSGEQSWFDYSYDSQRHLISVSMKHDDFNVITDIVWADGNISKISIDYESFWDDYTYAYSNSPRNYNAKFPIIHDFCGLLYIYLTVDPALAAEGYFGIITPADLPIMEYSESVNMVTRQYDYKIDKNGFIDEITQIDESSRRVQPKYNFTWR